MEKALKIGEKIITFIIKAWIFLAVFFCLSTWIPLPDIGSAEKIKQSNPKHQFENNNFQSLVEDWNLHYAEDENWNLHNYFDNCEMFAPNWQRMNSCVSAYKRCELHLNIIHYEENFDRASAVRKYYGKKNKEYTFCLEVGRYTTKSIREYSISGIKIFYLISMLTTLTPLELMFGSGSAYFLMGMR